MRIERVHEQRLPIGADGDAKAVELRANMATDLRVETVLPAAEGSAKVGCITRVEDVRKLVAAMVAQSYPELKDVTVEVVSRPFSDPLASMNSRPKVGTMLSAGPTRYLIEVNENVFGRQMTEEVAKGYLAHELAHTVYYVRRGLAGVLTGLFCELGRMVMGYRAGSSWERATDLEAIRRGYGAELKSSFEWYLSFLSAEERAQKLSRYLSPEEIGLAMATPRDAPIWQDWHDQWPHEVCENLRTPGTRLQQQSKASEKKGLRR